MTELELRRDSQPAVADAPHALVAWAEGARAAATLAASLCKTEFVPSHFRGSVESATAAIMHGAEIGMSPMQSLQAVYVISGRPALYARAMLAVTLAAGHKVWTEELTDNRAIVCGQRRGSDRVERVVWTLDRARKAGYTKNGKYQSDPQAMLLARAQADVCRRIAPDALLGMAYSVEELEDEQTNEAAPTVTSNGGKRTMKRAAPPPPPEPDLDEAPTPAVEEPSPQASDTITDAQMKKLQASFTEHGITERTERLEVVATIIGREVASAKDLTKEEASQVIDWFEQRSAPTSEPGFDDDAWLAGN